jgi:hypothetical protein
MKRLAHLKNNHNPAGPSTKRRIAPQTSKSKKTPNNPYPLSGIPGGTTARYEAISCSESSEHHESDSRSQSQPSLPDSGYDNQIPAVGRKSTAPTLSTNGDTALSEAAYSKAGTMATTGGGLSCVGGGEGSTFSSPAPSVRSLTTTLTTVQSAAPSGQVYGTQSGPHHGGGLAHPNSALSSASQQVQFSHPFPSSPAAAVPPYLAFHSYPMTYNTATANNILTDNASILTLASSSKRRRRNSLDTNASIRALAPSSIFGGSRESLPLSVLSGNVGEPSNASAMGASGILSRPSIGGLANAERASVYSAPGVAPHNSGGERSSYYANRQNSAVGDTGSIQSGIYSHVRNDSTAGSVAGMAGGPLASPAVRSSSVTDRASRRNSGWGELTNDRDDFSTENAKKVENADGAAVALSAEGTKETSHDENEP